MPGAPRSWKKQEGPSPGASALSNWTVSRSGSELKAAPWSLTSLSCPLGTVGSSSHETLMSEWVSHETVGRWSRKQAGPSHPSSWALVTHGDRAPCGAGLSASAQDPLVLIQSSAYSPRMTEGEILISPVWCRQGDTINYRVKGERLRVTQPQKRSEALTQAMMRMNLENMTLSERGQTEKDN